MLNILERLKLIISNFKYYLNVISDFITLNKYVFYSSIFFNKIEKVLYSDYDKEQILNIIEHAYSDFKINYSDDCFKEGIEINNKFTKEENYDRNY